MANRSEMTAIKKFLWKSRIDQINLHFHNMSFRLVLGLGKTNWEGVQRTVLKNEKNMLYLDAGESIHVAKLLGIWRDIFFCMSIARQQS